MLFYFAFEIFVGCRLFYGSDKYALNEPVNHRMTVTLSGVLPNIITIGCNMHFHLDIDLVLQVNSDVHKRYH